MSTLSVTTVQTANGITDLTLQTGNTSAAKIVIPASGAAINASANIFVNGTISITKSLTVSSDNSTGGGIILSDDGDIVDNNDGFCSMRFSNGVRVFSGNKTGSAVITLASNGNANVSSVVVSTNTLNLGTSSIAANGYSRLPNGLLMQWGQVSTNSTAGNITFPVAFSALYSITTTSVGTVNNSTYVTTLLAVNTSTANVRTVNATSRTVYYTAIGT